MRLEEGFFRRDVLLVAPYLLGKKIIRVFDNGIKEEHIITETEAYRGEEDLACHASKGRTPRTEVMYEQGGRVYVYLIYGMYWMLNFVTGSKDIPQAVLIRGIKDFDGPGKVGKKLELNKTFYKENLFTSDRIWLENTNDKVDFTTSPRVGIDYASEEWKNKPWRFTLK